MITKYTLTLLTLFCMSNIAAQTLNQAKQWFNEGKFAEAKPVFQRLVKQAPSNANYNFWYGACCFETGELAESQPYLEKSADRKVINAYLYLGKLYYMQYRFDDAVENLEEHISWLEKKERDTEEAEKVLSKCRMAARMIRNTERIIVADSFVVDKASFLQAYKLSKSAGEISITENGGTCYTNEWGDKMLYTQTSADGKNHLYSRMKLIDKWSDPQPLKGITLNEHNQICPFLNTDGITLYYATDGEENLGGYDIFITRYDSEDDTYLRPNNIGMPFNSPANDYMYAIDETNHLGWFASDRYQPEGKVCIYVFIPNDSKQVYDFENTEGQIVYDTENQYDGTLHDAQIKAIGENHVLKLDGAGSMQLPFDSLGFPYTVEFDLYLDGEQEEDAALFSSDDCTIYLNYEDRGLGFVRGKYGFTFDMEIPQDQWIHIVMTSKAPHYPGVDDTIVLIGDSWYSATKISGPGSQKSTTSLIGTKEIGSKIRGMMDNLALYQAHIAEIDDLEAAHLDGTGTKDDPYLIASAQDLTAFSLLTSIRNYENEYFVLTDDIDMSEVKVTPAGQQPFAGTLDGQGHVIKHLTIDSSTSETGLFHAIEKGTVKNLGIDGGEIKGTGRVGAIAGRTMYAVIQNCFNTSDVIGTSDVGGLVGMYNNSYMGNCYNLGNITGSHDGASFGGLVGSSNRSLDPETSSVIENCYNLGLVNSEDGRYTGSLIGYLETQEEFMQTYRSLYYLQGEDPTGFGLFERCHWRGYFRR